MLLLLFVGLLTFFYRQICQKSGSGKFECGSLEREDRAEFAGARCRFY